VRVYLAPGWRGTQETVAPWVRGLRRRGVDAEAILLGPGRAEQRTGAFLAVAAPDAVIGGLSFGGRVASLVAAERNVAGLLCIGYPLAGDPEGRTRHWPGISCPALVVNGDQDEITDASQLRDLVPLLSRGRLELITGGTHSLAPQLDQVLDLSAAFLSTL
jgi:predicted alpha/beta-hydrolase family hydrolase